MMTSWSVAKRCPECDHPNGHTARCSIPAEEAAAQARRPLVTNKLAHESDLHRFAVDASDLGLAPGEWPPQLNTDLGNGQPFVLTDAVEGAMIYRQAFGILTLTVYND